MSATIGFLIFPAMLQLDFTGPYGVLAAAPEAEIHLIWKSTDPVTSRDGLTFFPTTTMQNCPKLDILIVPGGTGVAPLLNDEQTLDFLWSQPNSVRYLASVCTGSLALGAAGLLAEYTATTHWLSKDMLSLFGAIPKTERVVIARTRITATGVTSGIDMALVLAGLLWGREEAETIQLGMEYAPSPPFHAGSPETAPPSMVASAVKRNQKNKPFGLTLPALPRTDYRFLDEKKTQDLPYRVIMRYY